MRDFIILSPLKIEQDAILARMTELGHAPTQDFIGPLRVYRFAPLGLTLSLAGLGKTQFGIQTQFFIDRVKPLDAVICAGCAGSLNREIKVGDVVVAEKTIEHDFLERFMPRPLPEFPGDPDLLVKAAVIQGDGFAVRLARIASGDEDVIEFARAEELRTETGASAVAWEGAGGARACQFNKIPFLEIRGVTDSANKEAMTDFKANLKQAMANVTDVILQLTSQPL